MIASQGRYNLEYCNNVTNAAGRRVRGFFGIEALVHPNISVFSGDSLRTYVPRDAPEEWRTEPLYVRTQHLALFPHILQTILTA